MCSADLLRNLLQLGGPGHVVAIDESVVARAKPGNARARPVPSRWIFGRVDLLRNLLQLGGPGHVVAIDESVVARAKPGNARARPVPPRWIFGRVDLGTGSFFMELVPQRDAATLIPIIQ